MMYIPALVDQPGSNWAMGFDLPDKEEPGSEVGGVVFMGGLAHLRCTFAIPGERMWRCIRVRAVGLHHRWSAWRGTGITARLTRTPGIGTSADYAAVIVESAKRPATTSIPE